MNTIEPTQNMLKTRQVAKKRWIRMLERLTTHVKNNGTCQVDNEVDKELSDWCSSQRKARNQAKLTPEQIKLLNDVEFIWDLRDHLWNKNFKEMKTFQAENGHTHPPTSTKLGRWGQTQRTDRKKNKLKPERRQLLDSIKFSWESKGAHGELSAAQLR